MATDILSWNDFMLAIMEGLDGVEYRDAKRIHKILYPEAKVHAASNNRVKITWPDQGDSE